MGVKVNDVMDIVYCTKKKKGMRVDKIKKFCIN